MGKSTHKEWNSYVVYTKGGRRWKEKFLLIAKMFVPNCKQALISSSSFENECEEFLGGFDAFVEKVLVVNM